MLYNSNKSYGPKEAALQYSETEQPPEDYYLNTMKQQFQGRAFNVEKDPNGLDPSAPGAKLDADKDLPYQILKQFPRALSAVVGIGTFGARKYSMGGWMHVLDAANRYGDAQFRHALKQMEGEDIDPDSGKPHLAHEAWNVLARLELYLQEKEKNGRVNRTVAAA